MPLLACSPGKLETGSYHLNPCEGGLETTGCGQRESCQFPVSPRPWALGHRFVPRRGRREDVSGCASRVSEWCWSSHRKVGTRDHETQEGLTVIPGRGQGSGRRRSPRPQECSEMAHTSSRGRRESFVPGGIQVPVKSVMAKCRPLARAGGLRPPAPWGGRPPPTKVTPPPPALVSPLEAPPAPKWGWPWRSAWEGSSGQLPGAG